MYMDSKNLIDLAAEACDDKKAVNINLIRIEEVSSLADWILITEGLSYVQVKAITTSVEQKLKEYANRIPIRREGLNEGKWALLDYGEIIINVMHTDQRKYYDLESFWSNGEVHSFNKVYGI